ncbi:MAG: preprotein translocase subunit SecE [Nitrospinota bacterium]|nr:preprotein translocase subunit SecE [Nitrospinota bacterium]MDH5756237.1 preprotein translocase subunit SecE [Nitrospinota bacterium]
MIKLSDAIQYLKEVKLETKKVVYPKRRDTLVTTYAVLVFVMVLAVILALFDWGLSGVTNLMLES